MNERLFARLHAWLAAGPVVLASVLDTRGATPRKGGSRMLIAASECYGSVGGGMAEARVLAAAHTLLHDAGRSAQVEIDLSGRHGAAGVCGGRMRIGLRRWHGVDDGLQAASIIDALTSGNSVTLDSDALGGGEPQRIHPDPRLLIIGAGHCGLALHDFANPLDFDVWVYDERSEALANFNDATRLSGPITSLSSALDTRRDVFAVLLNRDFQCDITALRMLCQQPPRFIGMMGSRKRISEVRAALPEHAAALANLHAPIGIDIGAQTPHEIAVSIFAELIQQRRALAL